MSIIKKFCGKNSVEPSATSLADSTTDNDLKTYYRDEDGDGYGSDGNKKTASSLPAGYTDKGGDCNDANAAIHPGAVEICGNAVDEDCDTYVDEGCANLSIIDITVYESDWIANLKVSLSKITDKEVKVNFTTLIELL